MEHSDPGSVRLTPEQLRFVEEQVRAGLYQSPTEAVREGLRMLEERERFIAAHRDEIRSKIEEGAAAAERGELLDGESVFAELDEMDRIEESAPQQHKRPA
jgi:antitoxin ParD1/3/4